MVEEEASQLQEVVLNRPPANDAEILLREQSIGEIRGLRRLKSLTKILIEDLEKQLTESDHAK